MSMVFFLISSAVSCGIPEAPGNGSFTGNEFTLDSKVTYECNEGFKLDANQQATAVCQEDGLWSNRGKPPTCRRKCSCPLAHLWRFHRDLRSLGAGVNLPSRMQADTSQYCNNLVPFIRTTQATSIETTPVT